MVLKPCDASDAQMIILSYQEHPALYSFSGTSGNRYLCNGVFTPKQDNDKTTRQMLNLCIPMMPFTPGLSDLV